MRSLYSRSSCCCCCCCVNIPMKAGCPGRFSGLSKVNRPRKNKLQNQKTEKGLLKKVVQWKRRHCDRPTRNINGTMDAADAVVSFFAVESDVQLGGGTSGVGTLGMGSSGAGGAGAGGMVVGRMGGVSGVGMNGMDLNGLDLNGLDDGIDLSMLMDTSFLLDPSLFISDLADSEIDFAPLVRYAKANFDVEIARSISQSLASIRPSLLQRAQGLSRDDAMARVAELDRAVRVMRPLIGASGTPALVWRPTGEALLTSSEFGAFTGRSLTESALYLLLAPASVADVLAQFSHAAVDATIPGFVCHSELICRDGSILRVACNVVIKRDVLSMPLCLVVSFLPILDTVTLRTAFSHTFPPSSSPSSSFSMSPFPTSSPSSDAPIITLIRPPA